MKLRSISALALAIFLFVGCGGGDDNAASNNAGASSANTDWMLASMPDDAQPVAELKKTAKEGDTVAIRGRIGGRMDPMSKDSAVFVIMDPAIPSCADMAIPDHCPTPWDYCCEKPDSKIANSATIQLVDESGSPREIDLQSFGLKPLDEVVVVGTVGPRPSEQVLTISATGLHRVKS